jgi:hypothetical protein
MKIVINDTPPADHLLAVALAFAVAFAFLVVIPAEPALSEVERGICYCCFNCLTVVSKTAKTSSLQSSKGNHQWMQLRY